ncbi:GH1 family beta-glucosidase [soil metagenome]
MLRLPKTFTFGIAESDLQTVGARLPQEKEDAQKTMWELFAQKQKIEAPLYGTFKYNNYKTDIKLLADLNVKAYRTSISMSRTIDADGKVNKKAIAWYRDYFTRLKEKGLEIHLCLYHWEAPDKFLQKGVIDPTFQDYFLKHTDIVIEHLGDLVDYYIPMNEFWCMCFLGYYIGIHAPGYNRDIVSFWKAYFALVEIQTKVIQKIKTTSKTKVGVVNIHFPSYIQKEHTADTAFINARHLADNVTNFMYSDPFFMGEMDEILVERFKKIFPKNHKEIITNAKMPTDIDYYGVNYYNSQYVKPADNDFGYDQVMPNDALYNSLGWPVALPPHYPPGLTDILLAYTHRYKGFGLKRLIVSENGTPAYTDLTSSAVPADDFRIYIIQEHLKLIEDAIAKGAIVDGYFLWTLMDNYEWQEGYKAEGAFGLVGVDKKTEKRILKKSYFWYQQLLKNFYNK